MCRAVIAGTWVLLALSSTPADAHFKLVTPSSWADQSTYGDPQKSAPCGQADPGNPAVPTGQITLIDTSTLTVELDETIFHPGHYRVAIANDQASLPADPAVTPGTTVCGSAKIETSPTLPVLGDGLLVHTSAFSNPRQTVQVQLPAGFTCTNCVLQVVQFMSEHGLNDPGGCFYHHCAVVTVVAPSDGGVDAGGPVDAGSTPVGSADAGALPDPGGEGCGCQGLPASAAAEVLAVVALVLTRRLRARTLVVRGAPRSRSGVRRARWFAVRDISDSR